MEQKSMSALVSAFARGYHSAQNSERIFDDYLAQKILSHEEYDQIADNMARGISFFHPSFQGTQQEALRWIVDNYLSPSPLGRAAFAEQALGRAVRIGAQQYLIFASGYDTFSYRQPEWAKELQIFELDQPAVVTDKLGRINRVTDEIPSNLHCITTDFTKFEWGACLLNSAAFDQTRISFCSLLGISYYLSKEVFREFIGAIASLTPKGSSIVFDYNDEDAYTERAGERAKKQAAMAAAAGEKMLAGYSYAEIERLLGDNNFLIYDHLTPDEITRQIFGTYNRANPQHAMTAFDNVNYCLAVRE